MSSIFDSTQTELLQQVNQIVSSPNQIVSNMFGSWNQAFDLLHGNPSKRPELLQMIGPYGAQLFNLNNILTTFMVTELSGLRDDIVNEILSKLNTLPNFFFNLDGSVNEVIVIPPSASPVSFKSPLSTTTFTGGSAMIQGTFSLVEPTAVPLNLDSFFTNVYFTPDDLGTYKVTTHTIPISVVPATMTDVTFILPSSLIYDGTFKQFDAIIGFGPSIVTKTYSGRNDTVYPKTNVPPIDVGDYTFTVASDDTYYIGSESYDFSISAAQLPQVTFIEPNLEYDGQPKTFSVTVSGADRIIPILGYIGRLTTNYPESDEAPTEVGDYTVTAYPPNINYVGTYSYDFTITPAPSS